MFIMLQIACDYHDLHSDHHFQPVVTGGRRHRGGSQAWLGVMGSPWLDGTVAVIHCEHL